MIGLRGPASVFARILAATLLAWMAIAMPAHAGIEPGHGKGWLTIASRSNPDDAIAFARRYADRFPTAVVFGSSNGYYAVSLGWADVGEGQQFLEALVSNGEVPQDSYYTAGKRFIQVVWSASNSGDYRLGRFLEVTRLPLYAVQPRPPASRPQAPQVTELPPRTARVSGLSRSGDNYLSLRSGPGTSNPEIARMRSDTRVTVNGESDGWYRLSLSNGMKGWAYGSYLTFEDIPIVSPDNDIPIVGPEQDRTAGSEPPPQPPQQEAPEEPEVATAPPPREEEDPPSRDPVATDQKRVALVFGNSDYQHTAALPNPRNDAEDMASKLQALGFEVVTGIDGTKSEMERSVREFVRILPGADVALFFYAGHAMQVNGRNHMIPVDAKLEDSTAIDFETIDLQVVLNFMNQNNRISIALLDACRDNPLSRRFARSLGATRSAFIGRGLAAPDTGAGEMLIGFATAPGEVALDGDGENSPFTTALLRHIDAEGLDVELMLKRVRQDVYEMTDQSQEPWVNSALRQEFKFNPGSN